MVQYTVFTFPSKVLSFDKTDTNLYLSETYRQNEDIKIEIIKIYRLGCISNTFTNVRDISWHIIKEFCCAQKITLQ